MALRKFTLLVILSLLLSRQYAYGFLPRPAWGVKAGMNVPYFENNEETELVGLVGFHVGMFAEWGFAGGYFAICPELQYKRSSMRMEWPFLSSDKKMIANIQNVDFNVLHTDISLDYVELPVVLRIYSGRVSVDMGVSASFLASARARYKSINNLTGSVVQPYPRKNLNNSVFSALGGLSCAYTHFSFGFRGVFGLSSIFKARYTSGMDFQVYCGYAF